MQAAAAGNRTHLRISRFSLRTRVERTIARALTFIVDLYRISISPLMGPSCRFQPTCSQYARQALRRHGPWRGVRLAAARILRCHPWSGGGYDPVP